MIFHLPGIIQRHKLLIYNLRTQRKFRLWLASGFNPEDDLVLIQKMMNKTKALIKYNTQFLQNQNYFYSDFHVIWTSLFKQVLKTKDSESVLSGSVVITWIQLCTLFSNHPGTSFTSNFFLSKQHQIFSEETEIHLRNLRIWSVCFTSFKEAKRVV